VKSVAEKVNAPHSILDKTSQVNPIVGVACNSLSSVAEAIVAQDERDDLIADLTSAMDDAFAYVEVVKNMSDRIDLLERYIAVAVRQTIEIAIFMKSYCRAGFAGRTVESTLSDPTSKAKEFVERFKSLKDDCGRGVAIQGAIVVARVLDTVTEIQRDQIVKDLKAILMPLDGRRPCLLGTTRQELLTQFATWLALTPDLPDKMSILWLYGLAGSGKSTVANTIAEMFH